ncbi:hypothetical protein BDW02DRAFT_626329 [Decorospora gaudefroyi]|uniref:Uncharacterized protein n=1 Tax=Decorospora gaudefroyi TaxID=184978 RepID=A0A6A5KLT6_9PLEO|nr:hypothetical protein BDW02DRAFT_626329 [Decorospora gaudefroyi]
MCEENAFGLPVHGELPIQAEDGCSVQSDYQPDLTLLFVCKSIYVEICDLLARTAAIHITDLGTIESLDDQLAVPEQHPLGSLSRMLCNITWLNISLRLPLKFFQALESLTKDDTTTTSIPNPDTEPASPNLTPWLQIGHTLSHFKRLAKLHLWFDYDEPGYWTAFNERALLEPLFTRLRSEPNSPEVSVFLPYLHPKFEKEDRHYVDVKLVGAVRLCRMVREREFAQIDAQGHVRIVHKDDFPFMLELHDYTIAAGFESISMEEMLENERAQWHAGVDVERLLREVREELGQLTN